MKKGGYVYILTNKKNGVLYTGVTSNLPQRLFQHKEHMNADSFSAKYNCIMLVYAEYFEEIEQAIITEKRIKKWNRDWKIRIIEEKNPEWNDLSGNL